MDTLRPRTILLLGVEFNNASLADIMKRLLARPSGARFGYVVTPNADHIDRLWRIPRLRMVYRHAMICLLDSQLIGNCARFFGLPRPEVVTGAGLAETLLARLEGRRVAVIGMTPKDFGALARRYPKVIFQHHQPPMGLLKNTPAFYAARDFVRRSHCPFTFIALGSPVQELLAYAIAIKRDAVGIGLCIGAGLEFSAGITPRAPLWMRRRGLEWLHRLCHDPARLAGRYLISDPKVLAALAIAAFRQKAH